MFGPTFGTEETTDLVLRFTDSHDWLSMKYIRMFMIAIFMSAVTCWAVALTLYGWGTTGKVYALLDGLYLGAFVSVSVYGFAKLLQEEKLKDITFVSIAIIISAGLYLTWHMLLMI